MQVIEEDSEPVISPAPQKPSTKRAKGSGKQQNKEPVSDIEEPQPVRTTRTTNTTGAQFKVPISSNVPKQKRARGVERDEQTEVVHQGDNVSHDSGLQSVSESSVSIEPYRKRLRHR